MGRDVAMRLRICCLLLNVSILVGMDCAPAVATGHRFLDLYGGLNMTNDNIVHGEDTLFFPPEAASRSLSYDPSFSIGARGGWWLTENFGVAADVSYFAANGTDVENWVVPLSLLLMGRMHFMKDDATGQGTLQPYLAVGPGLFLTGHHADFRPDITEKLDVFGVAVGLDARAGLRWMFSPAVGLFTEYRLTHFNVRADDNHRYSVTPATQELRATFTTHHVLGGVTFSF